MGNNLQTLADHVLIDRLDLLWNNIQNLAKNIHRNIVKFKFEIYVVDTYELNESEKRQKKDFFLLLVFFAVTLANSSKSLKSNFFLSM